MLICYTVKIWEREVGSELRFIEQKYGCILEKGTIEALFALRVFMDKYIFGQKELYCVFVDLDNAYVKVTREEVWYCIRKSDDRKSTRE